MTEHDRERIGCAVFFIALLAGILILCIQVWSAWDRRCAAMGGDAVSRGICYVKATGEVKGFVGR